MKVSNMQAFALGVLAWLVIVILICLYYSRADDYSQVPVNQCRDSIPLSHAPDGTLYGDANGDGLLAGDECKWR